MKAQLPERPAETELIARILSGNMRALEELMRMHNRMLYRTARAILRDDAEAEDAVQEAYLQAYRALGTFRGESKLSTWLVRITANEALMRRRRNAGASMPVAMDGEPDDFESNEAGPESGAEGAEMRRLLQARIGALPVHYRKVFAMRAIEERTVEETAAALGITQATVRTRYFRARNLLRELLAGEVLRHSSLDCPVVITQKDRARLIRLQPHAALLREIDRAAVVSLEAAILAHAITMNTQVFYTDETSGARHHLNLVYPQEAGGCACCVSILAPVGTALLGLSTGQTIDWDFPNGARRRLRVDQVIHRDCPINGATRA